MKYRALQDLAYRDDKGGWLVVKGGDKFTPPKHVNIPQAIQKGYIEEIEVKNED